MDVLDIEVGVEAVAGCFLLEVEDAHGIDHGRKVALHAGNVVGSEEVDVVERVGAIEGEGVATQVVDALLIGLALANGLHLEVLFGCNKVFVVEEQFAIVGTDDVVVDEPIHRLLVHTGHGEDAEGSLPCLASLCNEAYLVALLGRDDHHLAPRFLGSAEEFVEVDHLFGIAFELGLQVARQLALERAILYRHLALLLLLLQPVVLNGEGSIGNEHRALVPRVLVAEPPVAKGMCLTTQCRHYLTVDFRFLAEAGFVEKQEVQGLRVYGSLDLERGEVPHEAVVERDDIGPLLGLDDRPLEAELVVRAAPHEVYALLQSPPLNGGNGGGHGLGEELRLRVTHPRACALGHTLCHADAMGAYHTVGLTESACCQHTLVSRS